MRANRAFRLIVAREDARPAFLADPEHHDRIEVVSVDNGEVVLYWSLPPREAANLLRSLRTDLAGMQREEFLRAWEGADGPGDPG